MTYRPAIMSGLLLGSLYLFPPAPVLGSTPTATGDEHRQRSVEKTMPKHSYVGMWVTDDGHIRHELLPNGRYDEARGNQESAYQGRYEVEGTHIDYWDDTGFTADGKFVDQNALHHGGMIFRRR